ncbi:hypothetical protein JBE04_02445 [Streptomyces sp. PRKS01-29]|nr:hypothetical protein [Streptomyces sabulosicollis]MBI0293378.1 hypothetical protein [Streptomyces sabulosicollis]
MEAAVVWRVWRRILRESAVRDVVFGGRLDERAGVLGLDAAEVEVARAYAEHPAGARMFVHSYRFRMVSSFFNALETVAPLTHRALLANEVDLRAVAHDLLDRREWADSGPYVYSFGREILDHIAADTSLGRIDGLTELVALEGAAADVVVSAAGADPKDAREEPAGSLRLRLPCRAHTGHRDLSEWLRDPAALGRTSPAVRIRHYVIFLPSLDDARRIVAVPHRAADMVRILARYPVDLPHLAAELARRGHPAAPEQDQRTLARLVRMGLVAAPGGQN